MLSLKLIFKMMIRKKLTLLVLIPFLGLAQKQKKVKMYFETKNDSITYFVDNKEIYPVSLVFSSQPELDNLKKLNDLKNTLVVAGNTSKNKVITFVVNDKNKKWGIKKMPGFMIYTGDVTLKSYDSDYVYDLPFQKGKNFTVYQGYNGAFSHQNEFSLDFTMPEGTEILAAREGLVIDVEQSNNRGCPTKDCASLGNYISILHQDGTIAQYYHLKLNGSKLNVGDTVKKGDIIALSGNTGWSNGPHLHFVCFLPSSTGEKQRKTFKTLFKTGDGTKKEFLIEKKSYAKDY